METNYQDICSKHMNKYIGVVTTDGQTHDGFIAHVDQNYVTLAIPSNEMINQPNKMRRGQGSRAFGYSPGFYPGFYPGFFPRRRFYPYRIPFYGISSLFLLPFFI